MGSDHVAPWCDLAQLWPVPRPLCKHRASLCRALAQELVHHPTPPAVRTGQSPSSGVSRQAVGLEPESLAQRCELLHCLLPVIWLHAHACQHCLPALGVREKGNKNQKTTPDLSTSSEASLPHVHRAAWIYRADLRDSRAFPHGFLAKLPQRGASSGVKLRTDRASQHVTEPSSHPGQYLSAPILGPSIPRHPDSRELQTLIL